MLSSRERTSQPRGLAVTAETGPFFCSFLQRQLAPPKFDRFKDKQAGISRYTARAPPYLHITEGARDRFVGRERAWWRNALDSRANKRCFVEFLLGKKEARYSLFFWVLIVACATTPHTRERAKERCLSGVGLAYEYCGGRIGAQLRLLRFAGGRAYPARLNHVFLRSDVRSFNFRNRCDIFPPKRVS